MSLTTNGVCALQQRQVFRPERLKTAEQWIKATQSGKIGYSTVMANESSLTKSFGEDNFDLILSACRDLPGF